MSNTTVTTTLSDTTLAHITGNAPKAIAAIVAGDLPKVKRGTAPLRQLTTTEAKARKLGTWLTDEGKNKDVDAKTRLRLRNVGNYLLTVEPVAPAPKAADEPKKPAAKKTPAKAAPVKDEPVAA